MALSKEFETLASVLEAAQDLSHSDICKSLQDCLSDEYPGSYCFVADVYGDADSGDVVYCCAGEYSMAPYEISTVNGKRTHSIDFDQAKNVLPRTVYDEEADDDDHYAGASESQRKADFVERFPGSGEWKLRPFAERFISKDERKSADAGDFAGARRSFPILKPTDVMAAVRSIGRGVAGGQSATSLKNKIKSIAKRKGWTKYLPKAWRDEGDGDGKEAVAHHHGEAGAVLLCESAGFTEDVPLTEAASQADYPIKLIQPGRGSSGYYPQEVLERDGPKVFKAGTHMYWNHATPTEEAERPEGDMDKLAAVLTSDAYYESGGKHGPGLYARAKVMADYGDKIAEKAKYTGLSIKARGKYAEAKAPDGKPGLISALTAADSVDFVTKPGAGGKVLTEAAKVSESTQQENDMDKNEVQALIKEALAPVQAENQRLKQHLALTQAPGAIREALQEIRLPDAAKRRIIERLAPAAPFAEDGTIDKKKLGELVEAEAKAEAKFLEELGYGSGIASVGVRLSEKELREAGEKGEKQHEAALNESMNVLADIFVGPKLATGDDFAREARKMARKAFKKGRAA